MEHTTPACALTDCVSPNNWNKISRVDGSDNLRESWDIRTRSKIYDEFSMKKKYKATHKKNNNNNDKNKQTSVEM